MSQRLIDRRPAVATEDLIGQFVPPPHFGGVSLANYEPDPGFPTQAAGVAVAQAFLNAAALPARRRWLRKAAPPEFRPGIYFDGGFGVGKTHLLASIWHASEAPKTFGTFVEYTHLVGALGFAKTVTALSEYRLIAIDEFELDDPGDTVMMSSLLMALTQRGVRLAATSNTLPDALGEGRFAADDFLREIQGLAAHFDVVRIDGVDYRHRGNPPAPMPFTEDEIRETLRRSDDCIDEFWAMCDHLASIHPSRYAALIDAIGRVGWFNVRTLVDQDVALRLVVLIDRLYDRDIPVFASGQPVDQIFGQEMLRGGYRKKYFRAISRITALARLARDATDREGV